MPSRLHVPPCHWTFNARYVSYPSVSIAKQIDMEIIRMILESNDIGIERELDQQNTDYFRRQTVQIDTGDSE